MWRDRSSGTHGYHDDQVLPNGHDDIESVRIIRDPETLMGKGICYMLFSNREAVLAALTLHQVGQNAQIYYCFHIISDYSALPSLKRST